MYQLSGGRIKITYSTSGIDGRPHFSYQDSQNTKSFAGDQIRTVTSELGTLVSVSTRIAVETGSTTFSILIPRVNLSGQKIAVPVQTQGITTVHRLSVVESASPGQLDTYTVTPLNGTASSVVF